MGRNYDEMILRLPGRTEEKQWLTERMEVLSVRERIVFSSAKARDPPAIIA